MTQIEELFLAAYPLWPRALLEKFSGLLSLEVARFNPEINSGIIETYSALNKNLAFEIKPYSENVGHLLKPSNQAKISTAYKDREAFFVQTVEPAGGGFSFMPNTDVVWWMSAKFYYDNRLFKDINSKIEITYTRDSFVYTYTYLAIMSYSSESVVNLIPLALLKVYAQMMPYTGAASVLAMIENGVKVNVDQKLLSEFVTFLNAYNKYGGAMAATNALQAEKNRQTLTDYKNAMSEKLSNRKNNLGDLKTQISFAAKNETASAKRDMQGLLLSGQSLMIQLQDRLGQL